MKARYFVALGIVSLLVQFALFGNDEMIDAGITAQRLAELPQILMARY